MTKIPVVARSAGARSVSLMLALTFVVQTAGMAFAADAVADATPAAQTVAPATTPSPDPAAAASAQTTTPAMAAVEEADEESVKPDIAGRAIWKKGQTLSIDTDVEDIQPTDDINIATKQAQAYPDSPEASFIYAVNLTRTSRVEEALKEVRRARKLAEGKGGPAYFDKMIQTYETMLKNFPKEDRVRYHLAWAYYMKAYLTAKYSKKSALWKKANPELAAQLAAQAQAQLQSKSLAPSAVPVTPTNPANSAAAPEATSAAVATAPAAVPPPATGVPDTSSVGKLLGAVAGLANGNMSTDKLRIPSALETCEPADAPEIKRYYEAALRLLDEMLVNKPHDVWAIVYRAHLNAEYTGNLEGSMNIWRNAKKKYPNNPAAYFFLGEGYLRQGNLAESLNHVSKAVALRALGH